MSATAIALTFQRKRCIWLSNALYIWYIWVYGVTSRFDLFVCLLLQLNAHSHCDCHFASGFLWFAIISSFTSWNRRYYSHFGSISLSLVAVDDEQWFFLMIFPIYMRSTLELSKHPIFLKRKRKKVKTISWLEILCGNRLPFDPMIKPNKCDDAYSSKSKRYTTVSTHHKQVDGYSSCKSITNFGTCAICFVCIYAHTHINETEEWYDDCV